MRISRPFIAHLLGHVEATSIIRSKHRKKRTMISEIAIKAVFSITAKTTYVKNLDLHGFEVANGHEPLQLLKMRQRRISVHPLQNIG